MVAFLWTLGFLCQSLARQTISQVNIQSVMSTGPLYNAIQMDPRTLGKLDEDEAAEVCAKMQSKMGSSFDIEGGMDFKQAMRTEGGIDGVIAILRKHGKSLKVAINCLDALDNAVFYIEENQHYAGQHGDMEVLVDVLRSHMDDEDFITLHIGEMGGLMDFCQECGDIAQKHGSDELMLEVMKKIYE